MKKIILAVASVLVIGLVVGCKQQIEGSLTVTSLNKSLDQNTTKTYVYSVSGTATQTTLDHAMVVTKVKSGSTLGSRNRSDLYIAANSSQSNSAYEPLLNYCGNYPEANYSTSIIQYGYYPQAQYNN